MTNGKIIEFFEDIPNIRAFITTRNVGCMRDPAKVKELLCEIGLENCEIVFPIQTHTNVVEVIKKIPAERSENVDGSITSLENVALVTCHADCTPLFFYDPVKRVIAMVHSGWKGTAQKIGQVASYKMQKEYDCNPEDILVHIGPSIDKCCFEVDEDVFSQFKNPEYSTKILPDGRIKYNIDLKAYNRDMLTETGIPTENISISSSCTSCETDTFFSFRAEGINDRMIAAIVMTHK